MRKKYFRWILFIVMLALLTACGSNQNGNNDVNGNMPTAGEAALTATTAPTSEVTSDEVEKQPELTNAPEESEEPETAKTPTSPKDVKASLAEGDITYNMDELTFVKAPRTEYTMQEDGSVDVRFKQVDYSEIRFLLPARIDLNECSGITVRMRADYDVKCLLFNNSVLWNKDCSAFYEEYAYAEGSVKEYYLTLDKAEEVYGIGFAPTQEVNDFSLYKAAVYSVTFHAKRAEEVDDNVVQEEVKPTATPMPTEEPKVTEEVKPTATPTPTESPKVTETAKPTPTPMELEGKKLIAITVDDGTDGEGTESYLELAKKYNIPLTFFVIGNWSVNHAGQLQEILDAGCEIGNHSANHVKLTELSENEIKNEIEGAKKTVRKYAPDAQMNFVRAPYLAYNDTVLDAVEYPLIDAILHESDYDYKETLELLLNAEDGDIMMLHTWNKLSLQALEEAIPQMEKKGFAFVTVSQLFEAQGVEPQAGTIYRSVKKNVSYPKADVTNGDITYSADELKIAHANGVSSTTKNGKIELQFNKMYGQVRLAFPETIDSGQCIGVSIKLKAETTWLGVSAYDKTLITQPYSDEAEVFNIFTNIKENVSEHGISIPDVGDVCGIGLMYTGDVKTDGVYKATLESITFHMKSGNNVSIPKEIAPDVTEDMTLRNTYGTVFGYVGTCASLEELRNPAVVQEIKKEYNSITSGNEAKFDAIMANPAMLITVDEARKLGYVIPDSYKEAVVPKLNFQALDEILKICAENGLMYRFHTLLWHQQSLEWFYRSGYKNTGAYVSPEVMDARLEFYIRTVMEHVYSGEYGHIVYAWDVMNEYLHGNTENSGLVKVYGDHRLEPEFLKHVYEVADDVLRKYGIRDKVALVFNEYDTYLTVEGRNMTQDILSVMSYINSDRMLCDTIGMQSHMDTDVPIAGKQKKAIMAFLDAGYGVQFTEAEVNIKDPVTEKADQEKYYCEFMKTILEIAKDGGKITSLTFWGTGDNVSWLKEHTPLMFTHLGRPKDVYYRVLQLYVKPESVVIQEPIEISYDFNELKYLDSYGTNYTINKDGSMNIGFENQYQEIKFLVPEAIDMQYCMAVTVKAKSEYSDVSVKFYGEEVKTNTFCSELFIHWSCLGEGILDYEMYPKVEGDVVGIGFMSLQQVDDFSKYKATVYSVTFHMEPGYQQ